MGLEVQIVPQLLVKLSPLSPPSFPFIFPSLIYESIDCTCKCMHTLTHVHTHILIHTYTQAPTHTCSPTLDLQLFCIPIGEGPPQNIIKSDF